MLIPVSTSPLSGSAPLSAAAPGIGKSLFAFPETYESYYAKPGPTMPSPFHSAESIPSKGCTKAAASLISPLAPGLPRR